MPKQVYCFGGEYMSEAEYAKKLIDVIPEDKLGEVIEYMTSVAGEENGEATFELVSAHILEKYRGAFEELAK